MNNIITIMEKNLTALDEIVKLDNLVVYMTVGSLWLGMSLLLFCIVMDDPIVPKDHQLYAKVLELTKQIEDLKKETEEDDEEVAVFRFMNGESFYILDDDDEYVMVSPWHKPGRIVRIDHIEMRPVTRLHPGGGLTIYAEDIYGDMIRLSLTKFFDEFERDMFKEFIEDYF